jgi:hypothetical protein
MEASKFSEAQKAFNAIPAAGPRQRRGVTFGSVCLGNVRVLAGENCRRNPEQAGTNSNKSHCVVTGPAGSF